jgi:hypothetical protein
VQLYSVRACSTLNTLNTLNILNTDINEEDPAIHHKHVETPKLPHFLKTNEESGEE